jgi:hypothetical protein
MFKDEAMKSEICKKAYVAPKMTIVECSGPNLLSGSVETFGLDEDETPNCDCEFQ